MCQIALYFLRNTTVLSFYIDVVLSLSILKGCHNDITFGDDRGLMPQKSRNVIYIERDTDISLRNHSGFETMAYCVFITTGRNAANWITYDKYMG